MSRVPHASGDKPNAGKLKNKMSVCVAMKGKDKKTAPPLVNQTIFFDTKNSDVESFKKLPSGNQYCPQERIKSGLKYGLSNWLLYSVKQVTAL